MNRLHYLHVHWPLPPELRGDATPAGGFETPLRDEVGALCHRHGGELLALSAGRRRLHLLLRLPTHLAVARWVLLLKGATGRRLGRELNLPLHWERGYGLRSLSPSHVERARLAIQGLEAARDPSREGGAPLTRTSRDAILVGS